MDYKVFVTKDAEEAFERCIQHLLFEKKEYISSTKCFR